MSNKYYEAKVSLEIFQTSQENCSQIVALNKTYSETSTASVTPLSVGASIFYADTFDEDRCLGCLQEWKNFVAQKMRTPSQVWIWQFFCPLHTWQKLYLMLYGLDCRSHSVSSYSEGSDSGMVDWLVNSQSTVGICGFEKNKNCTDRIKLHRGFMCFGSQTKLQICTA